MAHKIKLQQPEWTVQHKDVVIEVANGDGKLGELHISKGSVEWQPTKHHKNICRMSWTKFADFMEKYGDPKRRD